MKTPEPHSPQMAVTAPNSWIDCSPHIPGRVAANDVQLEYLDWGGTGPPLILIHGLLANPHVFDDLATAFVDRSRVIAYARRGHGRSSVTGPYDNSTLTADLLGLMDALGIEAAHLAGWSMGGNEMTALAEQHPGRVRRLVYLDSGYDYADPDFKTAFEAMPPSLLYPPSGALASLDAYRTYLLATEFSTLDDIGRVEAYLRETVVIQPDGRVSARMSRDVAGAFYEALWTNPRREYTRVRAPALAIYAASMPDLEVADSERIELALQWEKYYMNPFRQKSVERIKRELPRVDVVTVPGSHDSFFFTHRKLIVEIMRRFLYEL